MVLAIPSLITIDSAGTLVEILSPQLIISHAATMDSNWWTTGVETSWKNF
ncbi:hypothetical protein SynBIOSE41_02105 [Synechococcus sp. BIOS-E4-1]|nr:hypothetical protein SynBIOSE41_02105 [Synechococcus sp. BIOS-E4-1]